jgi:hypothetical protein
MVEANQHSQNWGQLDKEAKATDVEPKEAITIVKESVEAKENIAKEGGIHTNN